MSVTLTIWQWYVTVLWVLEISKRVGEKEKDPLVDCRICFHSLIKMR